MDQIVARSSHGPVKRSAHRSHDPSRAPKGPVDASERKRAYERAAVNTRAVRILRVVFPLLAVGLVLLYPLFSQQRGLQFAEFGPAAADGQAQGQDERQRGRLTFDSTALSLSGAGMSNPRYEGFNADGSRYTVRAARATTAMRPGQPIALETIRGELTDAAQNVTHLAATRGVFEQQSGILELVEGIEIDRADGLKARLATAKINTKLRTIVSSEPVAVEMPSGKVTGRTLSIDQKSRVAVFGDGVDALFQDNSAPVTSAAQPDAAGAVREGLRASPGSEGAQTRDTTRTAQRLQLGIGPAAGASRGPIRVTSQTLTIHETENRAVFDRNVRAMQGDMVMQAASLAVAFDRRDNVDTGGAAGTPQSRPSAPQSVGAAGGALRTVTATGGVIITQGSQELRAPDAHFDLSTETGAMTGGVAMTGRGGQTARGQRLDFDQKTQRAVLTGDVELRQGGSTATGARLELDETAQSARLSGRVKVVQGDNVLSGELLIADQASNRASLTGDGAGNNRIAASFKRQAPSDSTKPRERPAAAPAARTGPQGFEFETDPDAPILIDAARLDIDDTRKTATFSGDVNARQGRFTIVAQRLVGTYTGSSGMLQANPGDTGTQTAPRTAAPTELREIVATGSVRVTSANGQTATGDRAVFDVRADTVTLTGNVTLTQGRNVIRGSALTVDMKTGVSRIDMTAGSGRSNATFFIDDLQNAARERKPGATASPPAAQRPPRPTAPGASSGWAPTTENR